MMSNNTLLTEESIEEINKILSSPEYYITPDGEATYSIDTDTLSYTMAHLSDMGNISKVIPFETSVKILGIDNVVKQVNELYKLSFGIKDTIETTEKWLKTVIEDEGGHVSLVINGKGMISGFALYIEKVNKDKTASKHIYTAKYVMLSTLMSNVKGSGRKLVLDGITRADNTKCDIMLISRNLKLVKYYEQFGFKVVNTQYDENHNPDKPVMVRYYK